MVVCFLIIVLSCLLSTEEWLFSFFLFFLFVCLFLPGPVGAFVVSQILKQFRQCIIMHAEEDSSICFPTPFLGGGIYPVFMTCIYSKQCKTEQ